MHREQTSENKGSSPSIKSLDRRLTEARNASCTAQSTVQSTEYLVMEYRYCRSGSGEEWAGGHDQGFPVPPERQTGTLPPLAI